MPRCPTFITFPFVAILLFSNLSCRQDSTNRVVVYCAHDREFSEEILDEFTKKSGLQVEVAYDTEANKSVGLYEKLIGEAAHPRCDVHWNNEILATIRLQKQGILQPYESPSSVPYPAVFKAKDHTWTAFAARARVLIVNTDKVKQADFPSSLWDLADPRWKGQIVMAKPFFGSTASQAACLFQVWGPEKAINFYGKLRANDVKFLPGNKQVAMAVGAGQFPIGLTDTDDAYEEILQKRPVAMLFPDGDAPATSDRGVLFIPNTVAMIKGSPNPEGAKKLIDFLLSPEVERRLADSRSKQIPLNPNVLVDSLEPIKTPRTVRALPVDFGLAVEQWKDSQAFLVKQFGAVR